MAILINSVTFDKFIDPNSFSYTINALSMNNSMQRIPIYINGSGPYDSPVTLTDKPSKDAANITLIIENDIGDYLVNTDLENPFYGTFLAPQVTTT